MSCIGCTAAGYELYFSWSTPCNFIVRLFLFPDVMALKGVQNFAMQVRIKADPGLEKWDVQIAAPPTFSRMHRLAPLFGLIFRRSSCQHPLLAGALGKFLLASPLVVLLPCPCRAPSSLG
jgi:hypothetical protein